MKRYIRAAVEPPENPRKDEYILYLTDHIGNVYRYWNEVLKPALEENMPDCVTEDDIIYCDMVIVRHDASKWEPEEWGPYLNHFYPAEGFEDDEAEYDRAWLHHLHNNPHHWQHWGMVNDDGSFKALDMPVGEILHMLCDWSSFSAHDPDSTGKAWYSENGDKMTLSDKTREIVDELIELCDVPLEAPKAE